MPAKLTASEAAKRARRGRRVREIVESSVGLRSGRALGRTGDIAGGVLRGAVASLGLVNPAKAARAAGAARAASSLKRKRRRRGRTLSPSEKFRRRSKINSITGKGTPEAKVTTSRRIPRRGPIRTR